MAFNFSAPTPAPAAGGSGFSFGGATSTTNAAPTPSTSLFGAKPASSTPAPASGGLFGAPGKRVHIYFILTVCIYSIIYDVFYFILLCLYHMSKLTTNFFINILLF